MPDSTARRCPVCDSAGGSLISADHAVPGNTYLRCGSCGAGYCGNDFSAQDVQKFYDDFYASAGAIGHSQWERKSRHLLGVAGLFLERLARFKPSGSLLDIGCGRGELIHVAAGTGRYLCTGIDISAQAAVEARARFGLEILTAPFEAGLFDGRKFDVIYLRHVVEHIHQLKSFVRDIAAVCAPGAVVAVHVPNDASFTNAAKRVLYRTGAIRECGALNYPYHVTGFTPASLELLFERAGFRTLATRTLSKLNRMYDFCATRLDYPMLPLSFLDSLPGRGNSIVSHFGWPG